MCEIDAGGAEQLQNTDRDTQYHRSHHEVMTRELGVLFVSSSLRGYVVNKNQPLRLRRLVETLEDQTERKLHQPGVTQLGGDHAELRVAEGATRRTEQHPVEKIKDLGPELESDLFRDAVFLKMAKSQLAIPWLRASDRVRPTLPKVKAGAG